jgi:hypothetical protein
VTSGERFVIVLVLAGYALIAISYWIESARRGLDDPDTRRAELLKEIRRHDS